MTLEEFNFEKLNTVKKCCVDFAKDGNNAVRHWINLYPMENITGEEKLKGFYMEVRRDACFTDYVVWNDCDGRIAVRYFMMGEEQEVSEIAKCMEKSMEYQGVEGYKRLVTRKEQTGAYINIADITALTLLGENDLAACCSRHRKRFIEQQRIREEEEAEKQAAERKKQAEEDQAEIAAKIAEAEKCIRDNKMIKNEVLGNGKCLILCLLKKNGINVPLKTQGWINNKLATVIFDSSGDIRIQFYRKKGCKSSESVYKYLYQLKTAVG